MVHTLEHGAVWITYNPDTISDADLTVLKGLVNNQPYTTLTPYPGLDATISLQAWAHQLKVNSATDTACQQFITALRQNRWVYPGDRRHLSAAEFRRRRIRRPSTRPPGRRDAIPMSGTRRERGT